MRDRVLNLPVMVALVLSIVYRQIAGISGEHLTVIVQGDKI